MPQKNTKKLCCLCGSPRPFRGAVDKGWRGLRIGNGPSHWACPWCRKKRRGETAAMDMDALLDHAQNVAMDEEDCPVGPVPEDPFK